MINIADITVKTPSELTIGLYDITEAERNAKGAMLIDFIARKYKLELTWSYLTQSELTALLNALQKSITFMVTFIDPLTGNNINKTCYCGDRTIPLLRYQNGVAEWQNFKVNLIEV